MASHTNWKTITISCEIHLVGHHFPFNMTHHAIQAQNSAWHLNWSSDSIMHVFFWNDYYLFLNYCYDVWSPLAFPMLGIHLLDLRLNKLVFLPHLFSTSSILNSFSIKEKKQQPAWSFDYLRQHTWLITGTF